MIKNNRREIYLIALVLIGLYLSLLETLIPKPFPLKIGLSNIVVLIALEKFNSKIAFEIAFLRIFIQGLMLGTLFTVGFLLSLTAGCITTLFMIFIYKFRRYFSLVAISAISAFLHNLVQLLVAYFLLFRNVSILSKSVLGIVFGFLFFGVISGGIIGVIVESLHLRREKL